MRPMHRQVLLLASALALSQTVAVLLATVGSLAGARLTAAPEWSTAPIAASFLGTALATVPASLSMARFGRKAGFVWGAALGAVGALIAGAGVFLSSMPLLCFGTFLIGGSQSFAQFYRFAAAEVASDSFRPRAISLVMAGGVVAAIAGPALARAGGDLLAPVYSGSFVLAALVSLVAAGLLTNLAIPPQPQAIANEAAARPLRTIMAQPDFLVALFGAVTGAGVMILAMTATPLAMAHHRHGLAETATVIQFHVLGMYLPSFVTGTLIARFGVLRIMFAGVLLLAGHILMSLSGTALSSFVAALVLLGVGWNFLYIGGTSLLTRTYTPAEKGKAQAANDLAIFIVGLLASLGAGVLQVSLGWQVLNLLLLPWLCLAGLAILWLGLRENKAEARS